MVTKHIAIVLALILAFAVPAWATQELDANADGKIDDALYSAYGNLSAESKIGTGATQVSQGNHTHTNVYVDGTLSATNGAVVCTTGTGQHTGAACGGVGTAGIIKWGTTGVPATATAGSDYVKGSSLSATSGALPCVSGTTQDTVGACGGVGTAGVVKWGTTGIPATAARSDLDAMNILGTYASPQSTTYTLNAADAYNFIIFVNGATNVTLPTAAAGMSGMIWLKGTGTLTITPGAGVVIVRDGTAQTAAHTMTLTGAAGNYVTLATDGTVWITGGYKGTLADGG